jgi:hypothetical protein
MTYAELFIARPDLREELEERAALLQYDGGLSRALAEEGAARILERKYRLGEPEQAGFEF